MPEDEEVAEDEDVERTELMTRPRTQNAFEEDDDDAEVYGETGEEIEEEYVCTLGVRRI